MHFHLLILSCLIDYVLVLFLRNSIEVEVPFHITKGMADVIIRIPLVASRTVVPLGV